MRAIDVIVEATDSDYILIAMLHYERQCDDVNMRNLGRVILRRIHTRGKQEEATKKKNGQEKQKRLMEHVHIPLLCEVMSNLVKGLFHMVDEEVTLRPPCETTIITPMMNLVVFIAFGGTDFVRSMPRIGPHRVWELLPVVLRGGEGVLAGKKKRIDLFKRDTIILDEVTSLLIFVPPTFHPGFLFSLKNSHTTGCDVRPCIEAPLCRSV